MSLPSVTVTVPIFVLATVSLESAPERVRRAVSAGALSLAVPTAVARLSVPLSNVPVIASKPVAVSYLRVAFTGAFEWFVTVILFAPSAQLQAAAVELSYV